MRRRMIDNVRLIMAENPIHPVCIPDGCDENDEIQLRMGDFQLLLDVVCIVLIDVNDDELLRMMACNLTAELASDGAAAPGYEDDLVLHIPDDGVDINLHRFTPEKVIHLDVAQLADRDLTIHELIHAGQRADLAPCLAAQRENILHLASGNARHGDDNLVNVVELCTLDDLVAAADDFDALNVPAPFSLVIIDDAADDHRGKMAAYDLLDNDVRGFAGSDHHNCRIVGAVFTLVLLRPEEAVREAAREFKCNQKENVKKIIALRNGLFFLTAVDLQQQTVHNPRQDAGDDKILQLLLAGICPQTVVHMEEIEDGECNEDRDRQQIPDRVDEVIRNRVVVEIVTD